MRRMLVLAAAAFICGASPASAQVVRGNDTSGIIPWSRAAELVARRDAQAHCASYGKFARITGVVRRPGNYISFNCLWKPGIWRYDLPPVGVASRHCRTIVRIVDGHRVHVRDCAARAVTVLHVRG